jgi:hypothetical protein
MTAKILDGRSQAHRREARPQAGPRRRAGRRGSGERGLCAQQGRSTRRSGMESFEHKLPADDRRRPKCSRSSRNSMPIRGRRHSRAACRCRSRSTPTACSTRSIRRRTSTAFIRECRAARDRRRRWRPARRSAASCCAKKRMVARRTGSGRARPLQHRRQAARAIAARRELRRSRSRIRAPRISRPCAGARTFCARDRQAGIGAGDWIKPGATVIDVGINRVPGSRTARPGSSATSPMKKRCEVAGAITPVPGGVGPMTIACLLVNTLRAACARAGLEAPGI